MLDIVCMKPLVNIFFMTENYSMHKCTKKLWQVPLAQKSCGKFLKLHTH